MSFILQAFHAPQARTVHEADAAMDALGEPTPEDRLRFIRFVSELTERFPNDLDDEDAPFPEGLTPEHLDDAVYVFAVNLDRLDENLMAHVAECASGAGLHVLDPQNGLLYRADGQTVRLDGRTSPTPIPRRVIPKAASRPLPAKMTPDALVEHFNAELCRRLAHLGFEADPRHGDARRMRGPVQQSIDIHVFPRESEVALFGSLGLRCRALTGVWLKGLGVEGAGVVRQLADGGWREPDFHLLLSTLPEPLDLETTKLGKLTYATDWTWAMAFLERWAAWVETEGVEHLARMESPAGIAAYLLAPGELREMPRRTDLPAGELLHRFALAAVYGAERRDEWIAALRLYARRFGDEFAKGDGPVRIPDFGATCDRLVAWFDTPGFESEAARLRALD
jgi:hypothetical protein